MTITLKILFIKKKTALTIFHIYFFPKRYYPGANKIPNVQDLVRFRQILDITTDEKTLIARSHALVHYSPTRTHLYEIYRHYSDPLFIAQLHQYYKNVHRPTKERINFDNFKSTVSSSIQAILDYKNQLESFERLFDIIANNLFVTDVIKFEDLQCYKKKLELSKSSLSDKEALFLKTLENFLFNHKKDFMNQQDPVELSSLKIDNMSITDFETMKPFSRCFTLEDYTLQKQFYEKAKKLVKENKNNLSDQQIIDILKHAKILKYGHVFWREDTYNVDSPSFGLTQQIKEAEGPKLLQKAYDLISNKKDNITFLIKDTPLTLNQLQELVDNLNNKEFSIGIFKRNLSLNVLLLSSQDLHLLCGVEDPCDSEYLLICGMFTSAKDDSTIKLSNTQEINDNPDEENKEQRFRPSTKFIRIKKSEFQEHTDATTFAKGVNKQGENVHQIIIDAIKSKLSSLQSNDIQEPVTFTKEALIDLVIIAFQQLIDDCDSQINIIRSKMKEYNENRKKRYVSDKGAQKKNYIKEEQERNYINSLSETDKLLYEIMKLLQKRKSSQHETSNKNTTTPTTTKIDQQEKIKIELSKESNVINTNNTHQHE